VDFCYVSISKSRIPMIFPYPHFKNAAAVKVVLLSGAVLKIFEAVISRIPVLVVGLQIGWANERKQHQPVRVEAPTLVSKGVPHVTVLRVFGGQKSPASNA
jgi:hypothetical protein